MVWVSIIQNVSHLCPLSGTLLRFLGYYLPAQGYRNWWCCHALAFCAPSRHIKIVEMSASGISRAATSSSPPDGLFTISLCQWRQSALEGATWSIQYMTHQFPLASLISIRPEDNSAQAPHGWRRCSPIFIRQLFSTKYTTHTILVGFLPHIPTSTKSMLSCTYVKFFSYNTLWKYGRNLESHEPESKYSFFSHHN